MSVDVSSLLFDNFIYLIFSSKLHLTFAHSSTNFVILYRMIRQYHNTSNVTMTTPNHYSLSDYGVGFGVTVYKVLDLKLMYAHTFGSNPAAINGKNSDGTSDQSRLLFFKYK